MTISEWNEMKSLVVILQSYGVHDQFLTDRFAYLQQLYLDDREQSRRKINAYYRSSNLDDEV